MALTTALSMLHYVAGNEDRNLVDRMHSYFTANLLIGLAVLVSFKVRLDFYCDHEILEITLLLDSLALVFM